MVFIPPSSGMTDLQLGELINSLADDVEGSHGHWQFIHRNRRLICVTNEHDDRMRIMTPVATLDDISGDMLQFALEANFDRAIDPRYSIHNGSVWAAFMHPLASLPPEHFVSACDQIVSMVETFGTTFTGGGLHFGNTEF